MQLAVKLASTVKGGILGILKNMLTAKGGSEITLVHYLMRSVTSRIGMQTKWIHVMLSFTTLGPGTLEPSVEGPWLGVPQPSQLTLSLFETSCSRWIHINLWSPMGFLPGYRKNWPISLQDISPLLFNSLGSLERSQLNGSWHMLSQFSRMVKRNTLVIAGLPVSHQCLVKLWRWIFWELLKNTQDNAVIGHSQLRFMRGKSC